MKTKLLRTALVIAGSLVAVTALADMAMEKTRAQVEAEYLQAQKEGTLPSIIEGEMKVLPPEPSLVTREQVESEYFRAQTAGTLPSIIEGEFPRWAESEHYDFDSLPATAAGMVSREQIQQEYLKAKEEGTLPPLSVGDTAPAE